MVTATIWMVVALSVLVFQGVVVLGWPRRRSLAQLFGGSGGRADEIGGRSAIDYPADEERYTDDVDAEAGLSSNATNLNANGLNAQRLIEEDDENDHWGGTVEPSRLR